MMLARSDDIPFDLRALTIFLAVCDEGGMAPAARRLGLTQPGVSLAVSELEARSGAALFDRAVRPIALTPAGALLRQRASALISEAREIAPLLREASRGRFPLVRVGLVDSLSRLIAVPLAERLAARAEEVSILSGLTSAHASALITRNLDVMIGVDDLGDVAGLERWPLVSEAYVLAAPRDAQPPRSVEALAAMAADLRFVRFSARSGTGVEVERHLRRIGVELPRGLEFDTPYGVTAMIAGGGHFAITTPLCLIEAGIDLAEIACFLLPGPQLRRQLTLVSYRSQLGRLPQELADLCRERLRSDAMTKIAARLPEVASAIEVR
jgi:DNA-binding transcriptional LysR family regulator